VSDGQYVVEFPNLSDLTDKGGNFEVTPVQTADNCTITTLVYARDNNILGRAPADASQRHAQP
jgi:hypothetical protein